MNSAADTAPVRTIPELADEITELSGHLNAANHRWLTLIAEFDRRKGWGSFGCYSCAHWLNWKCGIDKDTAACRWQGERMDYGMGVQVLLEREARVKRVSAEMLREEGKT